MQRRTRRRTCWWRGRRWGSSGGTRTVGVERGSLVCCGRSCPSDMLLLSPCQSGRRIVFLVDLRLALTGSATIL